MIKGLNNHLVLEVDLITSEDSEQPQLNSIGLVIDGSSNLKGSTVIYPLSEDIKSIITQNNVGIEKAYVFIKETELLGIFNDEEEL